MLVFTSSQMSVFCQQNVSSKSKKTTWENLYFIDFADMIKRLLSDREK
jgi:hypothetical protein